MERLAGKVALVTGGANGLGKAIALRLKAEGAIVIITDRSVADGRELASRHGLTFIAHDVTEESHWTSVMAETERQHGSLSILVNNAGVLPAGETTLETTSTSGWDQVFSVNVKGVFLGCRSSIPLLAKSRSASIINVSSIAALLATPYAIAYGASKAAVWQLSKSVAQYCAERRLPIRCNSIHPGNIRTDLWDNFAVRAAAEKGMSYEDFVAEVAVAIPAGELTRAEDVAASVAFLASDDARHITGTQLAIDGGILGCNNFRANPVQGPIGR